MARKKIFTQVVIFDMDGVITDTMRYHYRAWKKVFATVDVHVKHLDVYKREGQRGISSILGMCRDKGIVISRTTAQKLLDQKEALFKKIFKKRFIVGSRALIRGLARKQFRLALVTGTSFHEMEKILPKHIREKFEIVITGCDVRHGKPHPEPFLKALRLLNVSAQKAIVIENAPLGIESAKKANIRCFAIETSLPKSFLVQADQVFSSFKDLQKHIQFICQK